MKVLTDDSVTLMSAQTLRKTFRRWESGEGKQIVGSIRRIEIVDDDDKIGRVYFQARCVLSRIHAIERPGGLYTLWCLPSSLAARELRCRKQS